jgi:hypothetical protein
MLEHIAEARAGQGIRNGVARGMVLRQAYEAIGGIAAAAEIQSYREPSPASRQVEQTERDGGRSGGEDSD